MSLPPWQPSCDPAPPSLPPPKRNSCVHIARVPPSLKLQTRVLPPTNAANPTRSFAVPLGSSRDSRPSPFYKPPSFGLPDGQNLRMFPENGRALFCAIMCIPVFWALMGVTAPSKTRPDKGPGTGLPRPRPDRQVIAVQRIASQSLAVELPATTCFRVTAWATRVPDRHPPRTGYRGTERRRSPAFHRPRAAIPRNRAPQSEVCARYLEMSSMASPRAAGAADRLGSRPVIQHRYAAGHPSSRVVPLGG